MPFLRYFCSRQICFPVITTPFHLPVLNHMHTNARMRTYTNTTKSSQNTASTQTCIGTHPQASMANFRNLWRVEDEAYSPTHLSPPELFYSYHQIGRHQLFTSLTEGRQHNRENRKTEMLKLTSKANTDWDIGSGDGQTDSKSASYSDNKTVYQPISNSAMSFYQPASPSCVDKPEPCCLTEAAFASRMLREH